LDVLQGLAVRKDIPSAGHQASGANALNGEGGRETSKPVAGLSQAVIDDLIAYRQQIVKAALLRDPAATPDVLHYALCMQLLSGERGPGQTLQSAHFVGFCRKVQFWRGSSTGRTQLSCSRQCVKLFPCRQRAFVLAFLKHSPQLNSS
jgi:hypothetical protein